MRGRNIRFVGAMLLALAVMAGSAYSQLIPKKQLRSTFTDSIFYKDGSNAATGNFDFVSTYKLINVAAGTNPGDVVNKAQLDAISAGLDPKESCRATAATTIGATDLTSPSYANTGGTSTRGQITATLDVSGVWTVDGVTVVAGNRILIQGEGGLNGLGADSNGIYTVGISGTSLTLDRATDFDEDDEVSAGAYTFVEEGTLYTGTGFVLVTPDPITIGGASGTDLTFSVFSSVALASSGITSVDAGDSGTAGTAGNAARGDHEHAVSTAAPASQQPDQANAEGTSTDLARSDHIHQIPAGTPGAIQPDDSASEGTGSSFARDDHTHSIVSGTPGAIEPDDSAAEGSSTGFARDDHQHSIGAAVAGAISPGDSAAEGSATDFSRADHQHSIAVAAAVSVGTANAEGDSSSFSRANHVHDSGVRATSDKAQTPSNTSGDDADSGLTITATPALDSYVVVWVNGQQIEVGDGVDTACSYFADPGSPTTPKNISAIAASDKYIWNGTTCGFDLETTDRVSFGYDSF